jgi:hypothetical protein
MPAAEDAFSNPIQENGMPDSQKAWGAFRCEVFPAYDFAPIAADLKKQHS